MESRQPLILLTCSDTATLPSIWVYLGQNQVSYPGAIRVTSKRSSNRVRHTATGSSCSRILKRLVLRAHINAPNTM